MECVILIRLNSGDVVGIAEDDRLTRFSHMDAAIDVAEKHPLCQALPYQIVELDEL